MVELRKRKAPAEPAGEATATKKSNPPKPAGGKAKFGAIGGQEASAAAANGTSSSNGKLTVGESITLEGFGGEIETNDGDKTTLKKLVDDSKAGVVLFTYPKASTPGCTTQACLFRDSYTPLTATGLAIYGLSTDSPKSNTTFKTKQNLPYPLLCDPKATLIAAIGMKKPPKGTTRGVVVIDKEGKILAAEAGGPAATVEVVRTLVGSGPTTENVEDAPEGDEVEHAIEEGKMDAQTAEKQEATDAVPNDEKAMANVAADVADTAAKLDEGAEA